MKVGDLVRFSSPWRLMKRIRDNAMNKIAGAGVIVGTQEFLGLDNEIVTYRYQVKWVVTSHSGDEREWFDGEELEVIVDEGR